MEEIAFNLFSRTRDGSPEKSPLDLLSLYMAATVGLGVCATIFSQLCAHNFILVLYSETWATENTVRIMNAYCFCLIFMAGNGIVEAFAYGVAQKSVLGQL